MTPLMEATNFLNIRMKALIDAKPSSDVLIIVPAEEIDLDNDMWK